MFSTDFQTHHYVQWHHQWNSPTGTHLPACNGKQCLNQYIDYRPPENNGWQEFDYGLSPVWFSCSQFPPSLLRKPPRKSNSGRMTSALTLKEGHEDLNLQRRDRKEKMPQMLMKVIWHLLMTFLFIREWQLAVLFCSASETPYRNSDDLE